MLDLGVGPSNRENNSASWYQSRIFIGRTVRNMPKLVFCRHQSSTKKNRSAELFFLKKLKKMLGRPSAELFDPDPKSSFFSIACQEVPLMHEPKFQLGGSLPMSIVHPLPELFRNKPTSSLPPMRLKKAVPLNPKGL